MPLVIFFYLYLMFHTCAARFDVLVKFWIFRCIQTKPKTKDSSCQDPKFESGATIWSWQRRNARPQERGKKNRESDQRARERSCLTRQTATANKTRNVWEHVMQEKEFLSPPSLSPWQLRFRHLILLCINQHPCSPPNHD